MALIYNIKEIMKDSIIKKYFEYLDQEKIILIETEDLRPRMEELYMNNSKTVKSEVRRRLKEDMGDEYPSASVENILLDIFQDRVLNVNRLVDEITKYQERNFLERDYSPGAKSLGINIQITNNVCEIVDVKPGFPNMESVKEYRYLYSINGDRLYGDKESIVSTIRRHMDNSIGDSDSVSDSVFKLGLYCLKREN